MKKQAINQYMKGMFDFTPTYYQLDFAHDCLTYNRIIGNFCRQSGKSMITSKIAIMLARKNKPGDVIIFAPTERQTELISLKIFNAVNNMLYLSDFHCVAKTMTSFRFSNGRRIVCVTSAQSTMGETIRGFTAGDIILEEAGSIKDYIVSSVILPMGATTNPTVIKIGTSRGLNHFYESSVSSLYKVHTYDYTHAVKAGLISSEYIEEQRSSLSDIEFRTEYCAEFIPDQDSFFSYELIENSIDNSLGWDVPEYDPSYTYFLGGDIARMGQDSTCLIVVRVKNKKAEVCRIVTIKKSDLTYVIDRIEELHAFYKFKRIFVDETGIGAGVKDVLAKKYNPVKLHKGISISGFSKKAEYSDKVVGIKFTIQSKLDIYSNLKSLMALGLIKIPRHPDLVSQLRDFRYELTTNQNIKLHHSDGGHDDMNDALALAVKEVNTSNIAYAF